MKVMRKLNCATFDAADFEPMMNAFNSLPEDKETINRGIRSMEQGLDLLSKASADIRYMYVYERYIDKYIDMCDAFTDALYEARVAGQNVYEQTKHIQQLLRRL